MNKLIVATLKATPVIQADVDRRIWLAGALGRGEIPPDPKKPYILYKELTTLPFDAVQETSRSANRQFEFHANDERGSFLRIERILRNVREALLLLPGQWSPSGAFCLGAKWEGTSREFEDDTYDVNFKFLTMTFVASEGGS